MKLALVLLNWNGVEMLKRFLPDLIEYSKEATIYVIDNNSTDNSVAHLKSNFPQINLIQNPSNLGYAGGYNKGLENIKEELLCLINNDIRVTENWLPPILKLFKSNPNIAAAQPHILDEKDHSKFEYAGAAGGYIDRFGYPFCRGRIFDHLEKDQGQFNGDESIFWASGACLFIRNELFKQANGFDEDFFMHQEEIDLCWRLKNRGYEIFSVGNSKVYHLGGASLPNSPRKVFYNYRNSLFMIIKNVPFITLPFIFFIRLILDGISGIRFLIKGEITNCMSIIKAHLLVYLNFYRMFKKRKRLHFKQNYYKTNSIVLKYFILNKNKIKDI
ncbi:glycosyltransferase family 2 protein [Flavobacteriaceae bacterium]|nr:glycosyltransferase family 2 protein [Flavobacteriaceae bacterium]